MTRTNRLQWIREFDNSWTYIIGEEKVPGFKTEYSVIQAGLKRFKELEQWTKSKKNSKT
ncbi:MAG TPA: hypothetical protein VI146_08545 [Nitrososphaeraceae archaeon]